MLDCIDNNSNSSDLDIYVQNIDQIKDIFENFLKNYNYVWDTKHSVLNRAPYFNERMGKNVATYKRYFNLENNKFIDVIYINTTPMEFIRQFDLSICANVWNGREFIHQNKDMVEQKIGYYMNIPTQIEISRRKKYESRGYTIYDNKSEATKAMKN